MVYNERITFVQNCTRSACVLGKKKMAENKDYLLVDRVGGNYKVRSKTRNMSGEGTIGDLTTMILAHCNFGSEIKLGEPEYALWFSSQAGEFLGEGEISCLNNIVIYHNRVARSLNGDSGDKS